MISKKDLILETYLANRSALIYKDSVSRSYIKKYSFIPSTERL